MILGKSSHGSPTRSRSFSNLSYPSELSESTLFGLIFRDSVDVHLSARKIKEFKYSGWPLPHVTLLPPHRTTHTLYSLSPKSGLPTLPFLCL